MGGVLGLGEVVGGNGCKIMKCLYLCLFILVCIIYGVVVVVVMMVNGLLVVICINNFWLFYIKILVFCCVCWYLDYIIIILFYICYICGKEFGVLLIFCCG